MKKLLLTTRDIFVILLLVIFAQVITGISFLIHNQAYARIVAGVIYALVFYFGFRLLRRWLFSNTDSKIFPPQFHVHYLSYALGLTGLILVGYLIIGFRVVKPPLSHNLFTENLASILFADSLVAPFIEEVTFRGVILHQIAARYNSVVGVVVSSLLFGSVHLMNGQLDLISAIQLVLVGTLMGILLALIYIKEQSIWASFTVHASYNLLWSLFPFQTTVSHDWPIQFILRSHQQLITGGKYGVDCSLPNIIAYTVVVVVVAYQLYRSKGRFVR
ncbi:CPBP family intramembrane metalloprotease [Lactobacillus salivarius]|uniref:CPBP family intramembrane metalloprotease n=1 Tax=Ligilactobacillus salivarius TaxID=1624 RepID=A0A6A8LPP4_9LACO|nr:CPBP family intramembrane metalloprotease [Ligilactobacillus salivarius]MSE08007.1 CPBP family intramembrane metalloprotease [Ligilactobacillus salivarius]